MRLVYLIFASLSLTGCMGTGLEDLEAFVKNSGEDMRGKIPPPPEVKAYDAFLYRNEKDPNKPTDPYFDKYPLPDPFKPRKPVKINPDELAAENHTKEELEKFPLENLKMIGFLEQKKVSYAIIRAPDGRIFRVKEGNYLGLNFGKITAIANGEITIEELVRDSAGDANKRVSTLQLDEPGAK